MITGLNHYNIRTDLTTMNRLGKFYIDIVGLKDGYRPPYESKGYWLYSGKKDVLHLAVTKKNETKDHCLGCSFDHAAFSAKNYSKTINHLKKNNIDFYCREVPLLGNKQIFFKDPVGNGIEFFFLKRNQ
jgi:catechol-2,3-dioxygenase